MSCPERQQLLDRFRAAFDEYSVAVREQRSDLSAGDELQERSAQAQTQCELRWRELQQHQSRHKCWP